MRHCLPLHVWLMSRYFFLVCHVVAEEDGLNALVVALQEFGNEFAVGAVGIGDVTSDSGKSCMTPSTESVSITCLVAINTK